MEHAYTVEPTRVQKDYWKKWEAKTAVILPETILDSFMKRQGQRVINITTLDWSWCGRGRSLNLDLSLGREIGSGLDKNNYNELVTRASVAFRSADDRSESTIIGGEGDFSKKVLVEKAQRVMEKDIRRQHAEALKLIPSIVEQVYAYYAKNDIAT